ncbi:MAG: hypothetical protein U9O87_04530 [Verrucomicrobiota bacterium]|nr:hypothetical protein [Verrucomicrobiota bacterium]
MFLFMIVWAVIVFSALITVKGNPIYTLIEELPDDAIDLLADYMNHPPDEFPEELRAKFMQLGRYAIGQILLFLVEMLTAAYLLDKFFILAITIIIKDLVLILVSFYTMKYPKVSSEKIFNPLKTLPAWLISLDRFSYLLSSLIFIYIFFKMNV